MADTRDWGTALGRTGTQVVRRVRQVRDTLQTEGPQWVGDRVRTVIAERIMPKTALPSVETRDVLAADLGDPTVVPPAPYDPQTGLAVNWVIEPPSEGSGGHTTIFRILNHLQAQGCRNRVYFYDPYRGDHDYYAGIVRDYYGFAGPIARIGDGMVDAQAIFATSWPTAYPVYNARSLGKKFYFVQDFEPSFYAVSSDSVLAENTYRMRLHAITAGKWLAIKLHRDYGMAAAHFDFGCDTDRYRLENRGPRNGIAFYARPKATRRAYELGIMALELLADRRPDLELHFYGDRIGALPFAFVDHGLSSPAELNSIYNRCCAGLSLSLTNVSLVPHEMLAAGCIPVVNDAEHNRMVLDNDFVRYADPSPHALAAALAQAADSYSPTLAYKAATSVQSASWEDAGRQVHSILREALGIAVEPSATVSLPA